jgi:hypothetical protein
VRTAAGAAYSKADAVAAVTSLEGTLPGPVATSRVMAGIYFWSSTLSAAATNALVGAPGDADWLALQARAVRVAAAYSRLSGYRLRLRGFLLAAYNGALSTIQGDYPAG